MKLINIDIGVSSCPIGSNRTDHYIYIRFWKVYLFCLRIGINIKTAGLEGIEYIKVKNKFSSIYHPLRGGKCPLKFLQENKNTNQCESEE